MSDEQIDITNERLTLDGNAVGGLLQEVFGREMTAIENACGHCATVAPLAELRAYVHGPGVVLRCAACSGIVLRIVRTPRRLWLDGQGVTSFEVPAG
jgi:hypothetical protein